MSSLDLMIGGLQIVAHRCECHEDLLIGNTSYHATRKLKSIFGGEYWICPLRGKRIAELLAGGMYEMLDTITASSISDLSPKVQMLLSTVKWGDLLAEHEKGKQMLLLQLRIKLAWTNQLPWSICVFCHTNEDTARMHMRPIIAQYDNMSSEQQQLMHPTVRELCQDKRQQLNEWMQGKSRKELPELHAIAARLSFISITERNIEREHRVAQHGCNNPRHGPVLVSLARRMPVMELHMMQQPKLFEKIVNAFKLARKTRDIPQLLGLSLHPQILRLANEGKRNNTTAVFKCVSNILYRCDIADQFQDFSAAKKTNDRAQQQHTKAEARTLPPAAHARAVTFDSVVASAAQAHFAQTGDGSSFYSMPADLFQETNVQSLSTALSVPSSAAAAARAPDTNPLESAEAMEHVQQDVDTMMVPYQPDRDRDEPEHARQQIVFSLTKANVGAYKIMRTSPIAGRKLGKYDMAIAVHHFCDNDDGGIMVDMKPGLRCETLVMSSFATLNAERLVKELMVWTPDEDNTKLVLSGFAPRLATDADVASDLLQRFLSSHARTLTIKNGEETDSELRVLTELRTAQHVVSIADSDAATAWTLRQQAVQSMIARRGTLPPSLALVVREGVATAERTTFELIRILDLGGWSWRRLPSAKKSRLALPPYKPLDDNILVWYSSGSKVIPEYLMCLCDADTLHRTYAITEIVHTASQHMYKRLLHKGIAISLDKTSSAPALEGGAALQQLCDTPKRGHKRKRESKEGMSDVSDSEDSLQSMPEFEDTPSHLHDESASDTECASGDDPPETPHEPPTPPPVMYTPTSPIQVDAPVVLVPAPPTPTAISPVLVVEGFGEPPPTPQIIPPPHPPPSPLQLDDDVDKLFEPLSPEAFQSELGRLSSPASTHTRARSRATSVAGGDRCSDIELQGHGDLRWGHFAIKVRPPQTHRNQQSTYTSWKLHGKWLNHRQKPQHLQMQVRRSLALKLQ